MVSQTNALRLKSNNPGKKGKLKSQIINGEEWAPFLWNSQGKLSDEEFKDLDLPQGIDHLMAVVGGEKEKRSKVFAFGGERTNTTPQIAALNTLFLREHNRVALEVEKENSDWDDERVFQTARNIVIVIYLKIIVEEYVNHITSLGVKFKVDPAPWMWNAPWYKRNWISAEFAVLYRWHALVPNSENWEGKPVDTLNSIFDNRLVLEKNDGSLRKAFVDISSNQATTMQCFNTSKIMLPREKAALLQGRSVNLKPFGDYLEYLGLPRPKTFADISGYPEIQKKLEELYGTPDRVEFWVGLMASDLPPKYILSKPLTLFVANDAFNQALTNPLLSEHVFKEETFGPWGFKLVCEDQSVKKLVERNTEGGAPLKDSEFIGMTRPGWKLL
jgi:prostaglandin-endoperoxide synthase 2